MANAAIRIDEMAILAAFVVATSMTLAAMGWQMSRTQRQLPLAAQSTFVLTIMLMNTGNFGLPFIEFAFGAEGLQRATLVFVVQAIITSTLGIYVISAGSVSPLAGLKNIFTNPMPYATMLGIIFSVGGITLPQTLERTLRLLGSGAIPVMLLLLGMQIANAPLRNRQLIDTVTLAVLTRLVVTPLLLFALTTLLHITGVTQQVLIVQLSMPTAINAVILSEEYGGDVSLAATITLATTLASIVTLSILVSLVT
jgi:hypothetical protein